MIVQIIHEEYRPMNVIYAREPIEPSIFLAGPTPRDQATPSWRPEALELLEKHKFNGKVYVPEDRSGEAQFDYDDQVHWEWKALGSSTVIAFWVPRELRVMPAFTTNVEYGLYVRSGKCLLGYPWGAPKMQYLKTLADRFNVPVFEDMEKMIIAAIKKTDEVM